jgi:low temperature requirement protein LtrA
MNTLRPGRHTPRLHSPQRATFLELFFDLVFVFALTRISARAYNNLGVEVGGAETWNALVGSGKTLLLLLALWFVWQGTSWTTSQYDPYHLWLQFVVINALVAGLVMGVAIPRAFSSTGLLFAVAYVVAQITRPLVLQFVLRHHPERSLKLRMLITYSISGTFWIAGALVDNSLRVVLWALALALEYVAARFGWPVPGMGRSTTSRWAVVGEHLAERYQQIFLVALGETILVIGLTYSDDGGFSPAATVAFALAVATSVLLWRIYIQRAGQILAEAVSVSARPAAIGRSAADSHMIMVIGVVATAIGYELVIGHPLGEVPSSWLAVVLGGPALFVVGRSRFEYEVFGRVSRSRIIAVVLLVLLFWPLRGRPPLLAAAAPVVILTAMAVADVRRAWGKPPEPPSPPY